MERDDFFQALVSPYRREILRLLQDGGLSAGEISRHFDISQPSVSRHLDILKRAGLVFSQRRANQIIYSLDPSAAAEGALWLKELFSRRP